MSLTVKNGITSSGHRETKPVKVKITMRDKDREEHSIDIILDEIRANYDKIENFLIYYALRDYGARNIRDATRDTVKACVAIHKYGLPLTSSLVSAICGRPQQNVVNSLHILGDKYVVNMVKGESAGSGSYVWVVNETFLEHVREG